MQQNSQVTSSPYKTSHPKLNKTKTKQKLKSLEKYKRTYKQTNNQPKTNKTNYML